MIQKKLPKDKADSLQKGLPSDKVGNSIPVPRSLPNDKVDGSCSGSKTYGGGAAWKNGGKTQYPKKG